MTATQKEMTPAAQHEILKDCEPVRLGVRRVQATKRSRPLLHLAGFQRVRLFASYEVPVAIERGFYVLRR